MTRLFLVLGFMTAAAALAQTPPGSCSPQSVLNVVTGQPGWMLVSSPGVTTPKPAVTVSKPTPGWSPLAGASWVSVDGSGGSQGGAYTYQFTFCLCLSPPQGASLTLSYFADNSATVRLNSTPIPAAAIAGPKGFTGKAGGVANYTGAGFVIGTNTLTIVVVNEADTTGLEAVLKVVGAVAGACPPPPACPTLSFSYQSRANSSVVNASFSVTDKGPGSATNVTITGITCTNGFVYAPQNGLLKIPFVVPGAANLGLNLTSGFNVFLARPGASLNAPTACTLTYTDGNGCKGTQVVNVPQ